MRKQKKLISTSSLSTREYGRFLRNLDVVAVGLEQVSAKLDRPGLARLRSKKNNGIRKIAALYRVDAFEGDHFDLTATFKFFYTNRETKETPLVIVCDFRSHFHGEKPLSERFVQQFAGAEFRLIVWPYFRQFIFDTTARMAIAPITIPLTDENEQTRS